MLLLTRITADEFCHRSGALLEPIVRACVETRYQPSKSYATDNYSIKSLMNSDYWDIGYAGSRQITHWLQSWGVPVRREDDYYSLVRLKPLAHVYNPLPMFGSYLSSRADSSLFPAPDQPSMSIRNYTRIHAEGYEGDVADAFTKAGVWEGYGELIRSYPPSFQHWLVQQKEYFKHWCKPKASIHTMAVRSLERNPRYYKELRELANSFSSLFPHSHEVPDLREFIV